MIDKNEEMDELNEISANFDPLLNRDMLRLINLRESLIKIKRQNNVGLFSVDYGHKIDDLDEFEQALI